MNIELLLFGFGCGVVGIVIGLVVANVFRADNGSLKKIEAELAEAQEKLKRQAEHFAESENMLHKLGKDLRDLYQHMSSNEISTLKEKFKGLVIDADAPLDKLAHKEEGATQQAEENGEEITAEKTSEEAIDEVIEELAEPTEPASEEAITEQDASTKASEEATVEDESADQPVEDVEEITKEENETSDDIEEKTNETIDEVAEKNKKD